MSDFSVDLVTGRKMWRTLEPVHGMIYFAPEATAAYASLGIAEGYFASRAAPMGPVPAEVVIATFFNFNPALVRRSIPSAWTIASPAVVLEARLSAADDALRRILGPLIESPEMEEAAALAHRAASCPDMSPAGRPLYAGHASLPWPSEPHLVLWHAISVLREYRGDGHIALLTAAGLTGIEALVIHAGTGEVPRAVLQQSRAWSDDDWAFGVASLEQRGWATADGSLTSSGVAHREGVEELTDQLALAPWSHLGTADCDRLRFLVRPFSKAVVAAGTFGR